MIATEVGTTRTLATFIAGVTFDSLPPTVVDRAKDLFLDWLGSALAGKDARPVSVLERFSETMGPSDGASEILTSRRRSSPFFAALVNGAASHVVEQDDVHNGSVFHPGTVVFPPLLAAAQEQRSSGRDFLAAAVVGYEAGIRTGRFLGRSHYRVFHTTGTAGTLASAAAVARLLRLDERTVLHALGSAGTEASGLWEFLRDGADSKQLHTAMASAVGLLAAYTACDGLTGAAAILEGAQGMASGMSTDADQAQLGDGLGEHWAILDTSYKFHASCRHTHPAADALLQLMQDHHLVARDIARVRAHVHEAAIDVLGPVVNPHSVHQAKFSMGFVLALIALRGQAGIADFSEDSLVDPTVRAFMGKVGMVLDPEVDAAYPRQWIGLVEVQTTDGRTVQSRVDTPKGDPGNPLSPYELEAKVRRLAAYRSGATPDEMTAIIQQIRRLDEMATIPHFLSGR